MNSYDLKQIDNLVKKRLKNFATKDDLKQELKDYPTKADLNKELKGFATKADLNSFATKADLKDLKNQFELKIDEAVASIIEVVDKNKADKKDLDIIETRVSKIEEELSIAS